MILRRLEGSRYSEVIPAWEGETVAIIGGGPSLTTDQIEAVHGVRCVAINNSYQLAPWADALYFSDWEWFDNNPAARNFAGLKISIQNERAQVVDASVHLLRNGGADGLSNDPKEIRTGRNSGYQVVNLLVLAGVKKIILLGVDGQKSDAGRTHWHAGHKYPTPDAAFELYRKAFSSIEHQIAAMGVRIFNCSAHSAIGFEKVTVAEALKLSV